MSILWVVPHGSIVCSLVKLPYLVLLLAIYSKQNQLYHHEMIQHIWKLWELFDQQICVHDIGFDLLDFDGSLDDMGGRINELEQSINDLRAEMGVEGTPPPASKSGDEPKTPASSS